MFTITRYKEAKRKQIFNSTLFKIRKEIQLCKFKLIILKVLVPFWKGGKEKKLPFSKYQPLFMAYNSDGLSTRQIMTHRKGFYNNLGKTAGYQSWPVVLLWQDATSYGLRRRLLEVKECGTSVHFTISYILPFH